MASDTGYLLGRRGAPCIAASTGQGLHTQLRACGCSLHLSGNSIVIYVTLVLYSIVVMEQDQVCQ